MCRKSKYIYLLHAYTRIYYHVYIYIYVCVCDRERERKCTCMSVQINIHTHICFFFWVWLWALCQGLKAATIYKPKFAEGDPEATRKVANGDMVTVDLTLGGGNKNRSYWVEWPVWVEKLCFPSLNEHTYITKSHCMIRPKFGRSVSSICSRKWIDEQMNHI
jgi:hypothetical protein